MGYRGLDTLEHVDDGVYGTYLERTPARFFDRVPEVPFDDRETVVADLDVDRRVDAGRPGG